MKDMIIYILGGFCIGFIVGVIMLRMAYGAIDKHEAEPTPQPFQLETVQLQRGNTLITVCIDKRTQQAVPCTAFFSPL